MFHTTCFLFSTIVYELLFSVLLIMINRLGDAPRGRWAAPWLAANELGCRLFLLGKKSKTSKYKILYIFFIDVKLDFMRLAHHVDAFVILRF